jgi:hypothetical protein
MISLGIVQDADAGKRTRGIPRVIDDVAVLQGSVDDLQMQVGAITADLSDLIDSVDNLKQGSATDFLDVTGSLCFDVGLGVQPKFTNVTRGRIEIEGGVGVDVYGNGIEVDLEPVNDSKFSLGLGLKANATLRICGNLGVLKALDQAGVLTAAAADTSTLESDVRAAQMALRDTLPAMVNNIGLQPANVPALFQQVQDFDFDLTNPAQMVAEGPQKLQDIVALMPMPPALRSRVVSGGNPLEAIAQQLGNPRDAICNNVAALPPAVADRLNAICSDQTGTQLAATISDIKTAVNGVTNTVNTIKNALPTKDDCKFFCK